MPSLGADMESGKLVEWLVKPGETVHKGDVIAVVETHKGAIDVEIFEEGKVAELCVKEGETVPVGALLAQIAVSAETVASAAPVPAPPAPSPPTASPTRPVTQLTPVPPLTARVKVSPAARRIAASLGIDPEQIRGTGVEGAVTFADVELARATGIKPALLPHPDRHGSFDPIEMRRAIAAAMSRSKREIPHYYLSSTVDMTPALEWLAAYNAERTPDQRMLASVLLMKASALAMRKVPQFNGFWQDESFRPVAGIHLGWAISLRGGGLVAPAIHNADNLPLADLMAKMKDLVGRARSGGLRSSELMDATITLTSLGERGADSVTGVIYPPQVAILGFGRIGQRPWVVDGKVEPRALVEVTLAADHRASDGHAGGLFLSAIEQFLREPDTL